MAISHEKITEEAYSRLVFETRGWHLEFLDGVVREKPGTTWDHGHVKMELIRQLMDQLDHSAYLVSVMLRVRQPPATILVPDLMVVPDAYGEEFRGKPDTLAIFSDPLPLVVEIWTCIDDYDVDAKVPIYQQRGDREIWRIHPYEKTLTARRRQPDDSYDETVHSEGVISPIALPEVEITMSELFDTFTRTSVLRPRKGAA